MRGAWALVSVLMHVLTTLVILILVVYCLAKARSSAQVFARQSILRLADHLLTGAQTPDVWLDDS